MYHKNYDLIKFDNGFRIVNQANEDDKFHMLDKDIVKTGDTYVVGPNGYFEYKGNIMEQFEENVSNDMA